MPLSLHAVLVPSWIQILGACRDWMDKAELHCSANALPESALIGARITGDMLPLSYQVKSCTVHSIGAIEGVRRGTFSPDWSEPPESFAALRDQIDQSLSALNALDVAEMESFIGRPMIFTIGDKYRLDFVAENFLLSFTQPNFFFHATTAYDILRARDVKLGKRDFLGALTISH